MYNQTSNANEDNSQQPTPLQNLTQQSETQSVNQSGTQTNAEPNSAPDNQPDNQQYYSTYPPQYPNIPSKYGWYPYQHAVKPKIIYTKKDAVVALLCLVLGYLFSRWITFSRGGIGTTLFCISAIFTAFFYLRSYKKKLTSESIGFMVILLLFSFAFSLTSAVWAQLFCFWFLLFGFIYWYFASSGNRSQSYLGDLLFFDMIKAIFVMPFGSFDNIFNALFSSHQKNGSENKEHHVLGWVIIGLIIAIIPTIIVIALLSSADGAFANLIELIGDNFNFNFFSFFTQMGYLIFGIPVAMYIFGLLFGNARNKHMDVLTNEYDLKAKKSAQFAPSAFVYAAITPICIVYVLFFIAQSAYLFSAFAGIKPSNIDYTNYARSGFFEMCAVVFINLLAIIFITAFCKRKDEKVPVSIRIYTSLLSIFSLAMIAISLSKMMMYIQKSGLTEKRVYTSWLMILLAVLFIFILIKQITLKFRILPVCSVCCILLLCVLAFGNVDGNIAKYNVNRYLEGTLTNMDVDFFYDLSDEAVEYAVPLLDDNNPEIRQAAEKYLQKSANRISALKPRSYTLGTISAKSALEKAGITAQKD